MLFADDNPVDAVNRLMDFVRDFSDGKDDCLNEVIVISANFRRLDKAERRGTAKYSEIETTRNKLLFQALELMDSVIALPEDRN